MDGKCIKKYGKKAFIEITIPLKRSIKALSPRNIEETIPDLNILYVDDMVMNLKVMQKILNNYNLTIKNNTDDLLGIILRREYDVYLLDNQLGDELGIEFAKYVHKKDFVAILSGDEILTNLPCFIKPFDPIELKKWLLDCYIKRRKIDN